MPVPFWAYADHPVYPFPCGLTEYDFTRYFLVSKRILYEAWYIEEMQYRSVVVQTSEVLVSN